MTYFSYYFLFFSSFNPLETSPEYTLAGVYGKCLLWQNQIVFNGLIANISNWYKLIYLFLHLNSSHIPDARRNRSNILMYQGKHKVYILSFNVE